MAASLQAAEKIFSEPAHETLARQPQAMQHLLCWGDELCAHPDWHPTLFWPQAKVLWEETNFLSPVLVPVGRQAFVDG